MDTLQPCATSNLHGERGSGTAWFHPVLSHQAQLGGRGSEGRDGWHLRACLRVSDGCGKRRQRAPNEKMEGGEERERRGWEEGGGTTFLFSALPGDLKTPPNRPFGLFGAFGQSGRLGGVLRQLVAVAPGGFGCRGLLRPRAAAELRGGGEAAAAAILWGGLKLRKRWLHPVVSAASTAFPARVRRRGLGLRGSRHRAGVRSSGKLPPTRSTGLGGKDGGLARGRILLNPPSPSSAPGVALQPQGGRSDLHAAQTEPLAPRAALDSGGFSTGPGLPTC